jgi:hypothetical protein
LISLETLGDNLNENLQVLILSNSPAKVLEKTIRFWSTTDFSVVVIHQVLDFPLKASLLQRSPNIGYHIVNSNFNARLKYATEFVYKDLMVVVPDDEIMLPSTLTKISKIMIQNDEFGSVGGITIAAQKYGFTYSATSVYKHFANYSNLSNFSLDRVHYHFGRSGEKTQVAHCYRVIRTEIFFKIVSILSLIDDQECPYLFEVIAELVLTLSAKSINIDQALWIRNWIRPSSTPSIERENYYHYWIEKRKSNRDNIVSSLNSVLCELPLFDIEAAVDLSTSNRKRLETYEASRLMSIPANTTVRRSLRYLKSLKQLAFSRRLFRMDEDVTSLLTESKLKDEFINAFNVVKSY